MSSNVSTTRTTSAGTHKAAVQRLLPGHDHPQVQQWRSAFPGLAQHIHGHPLVYLDNAATTQRLQPVIDALLYAYTYQSANIHRGVHSLSAAATAAFEATRGEVTKFLHARSPREIIFTRGTTESVNLVAQTFGRQHTAAGDVILISAAEHHSNLVPWQMLCQSQQAQLQVIPLLPNGELDMAAYLAFLDGPLAARTRLLAISHVSNALGSIYPLTKMISLAKARGIAVLVDGAQAVPHLPVDVQALDCDFYAFSAHKLFGPTGVGVLYGREALLEAMPPYQGGGEMIASVSWAHTTYNELPYKFEAGTPDIHGVCAFRAALTYLQRLGYPAIHNHESALLTYATQQLKRLSGLHIIGAAAQKAGVISFVLDGVHPHDIGTVLDQHGIAIRTGHHCAQPVMDFYKIPATARISLAFYNTCAEIDVCVDALQRVIRMFR